MPSGQWVGGCGCCVDCEEAWLVVVVMFPILSLKKHGWSITQYQYFFKNNFFLLNDLDTSIQADVSFDRYTIIEKWEMYSGAWHFIGRCYLHILNTHQLKDIVLIMSLKRVWLHQKGGVASLLFLLQPHALNSGNVWKLVLSMGCCASHQESLGL